MAQNADPDIQFSRMVWPCSRSLRACLELDNLLDLIHPLPTELNDVTAKLRLAWMWQWAEDGFWSFTSGHKVAAALMATSAGGLEGLLHYPAHAVRIGIPPGLLDVSTGDDLRWLYLGAENADAGVPAYALLYGNRIGDDVHPSFIRQRLALTADSLDQLLLSADPIPDSSLRDLFEDYDRNERLLRLALRYTVGLLYTHQYTTNFTSRSHPVRPHNNSSRNPPDHRTVFVGGPISVDARPQIREWLSTPGTRPHAPPSLQHLVRGHYKRQVIGQGRSGRKVIWVEPYWRGPEDAPILVHPRVVSPD